MTSSVYYVTSVFNYSIIVAVQHKLHL